ncbi:hypothetical protein MPTK1_4g18360 [Marchantia polymorpha subsp. ruderalis]|uniref:Uncharacterized protein n=2 Tax=Marchantia polymorpha TaxID=3197 RepID=A0AAF6BB84_MARPO|nr:hypothetical protein MARPO_0041s0117 [Marchantia polymorpha]BBN09268.1 hypothetical protein Mp_4g18360 [Marchantia polymorpha subsp. ruderalis]|eukprot:PTQ40256.1 hypothetical protein MARPO_0041s0117 [Marchantia polymorpha]
MGPTIIPPATIRSRSFPGRRPCFRSCTSVRRTSLHGAVLQQGIARRSTIDYSSPPVPLEEAGGRPTYLNCMLRRWIRRLAPQIIAVREGEQRESLPVVAISLVRLPTTVLLYLPHAYSPTTFLKAERATARENRGTRPCQQRQESNNSKFKRWEGPISNRTGRERQRVVTIGSASVPEKLWLPLRLPLREKGVVEVEVAFGTRGEPLPRCA